MTDRVHSLTVVMDANYRDDDIQKLIDAIGLFAGVIRVQAHVADPVSLMAETRAKRDLQARLDALVESG